MKCEKHPNNDAVAQCAECGAGICKDCSANTKEVREHYGALCLDCYAEHIKQVLVNATEELGRIKRRIKGKIVCYLIGLVCLAIGGIMLLAKIAGPVEPFLVFGVFFCGIYMGIAGWKSASAGYEETEEKFGARYTVTSDGSVYKNQGCGIKIFFFLLALAFGIIATPLSLISDSVSKKEMEETVVAFEEEIERISTL